MASQKLHQHPEYDDEEYVNGEAFAANVGRHLQELQRLSAFQQVATKYHLPMTAEAAGSSMKMPSMTGLHNRVRARRNMDQP